MGFWDVIWLLIWSFVMVSYLIVFFLIIVDLFRDHTLNGWWKALWIVLLFFIPFLTAIVYLVVRGTAMAQRYQGNDPRPVDDTEQYLAYRPSDTPASDIHRAKELLDRGVISQGEFEALKDKALGHKF
ncbi:SHOCT domain-containing protein [Compostimonas suwonensis]|uniref:Phospholipase D-like protein n=1 Tax=Compostimonas suwonensis TaxID=1048394 RepID=A0A2M9BBX4_9MICO|nr:SHOCT domain-containing protein [Compostimonas suwonensis]PJJ55414.1 phospholipase D-like protein [Compostimonas suwonensis]